MWSSRRNSEGRLRAGSAPLDHMDGSASLYHGAIRERRSYWLCSAARPPLTLWKKNVVIGPKRKPSSGWAVELRRFICERAGSVFCERVGSVFSASFEITQQLTLRRKFSSFVSIQMQNDEIYKGQIYFYHAKWSPTIQKLSPFVHIIYMTMDSHACN